MSLRNYSLETLSVACGYSRFTLLLETSLAARREERGETAAMYSQATMSAAIKCSKCLLVCPRAQGPEEMYLSLEHQNPSKTSEKMANNKVDLADLGQIRSEEIVYCRLIIKIPLIWAN